MATVRPARLPDLLALARMELAYVQEKYPERTDLSLDDAYAYIARETARPDCVALMSDECDGFTLVYKIKTRWYGPETLHLDHTYIAPAHRSVKTLKSHFEAVKAVALQLGCSRVATLWHPADEADRVDRAMQAIGWQRAGLYYEGEL